MGWQLSLLVRCRAWDGKQHRLGGEIGMALYRQVLPGRYWLNSSPSRWHNIHFNSLGMKCMWSSIPVILILNINDSTFILLAIQIALIAKSAIITHLTTQYAQVVKSSLCPILEKAMDWWLYWSEIYFAELMEQSFLSFTQSKGLWATKTRKTKTEICNSHLQNWI